MAEIVVSWYGRRHLRGGARAPLRARRLAREDGNVMEITTIIAPEVALKFMSSLALPAAIIIIKVGNIENNSDVLA